MRRAVVALPVGLLAGALCHLSACSPERIAGAHCRSALPKRFARVLRHSARRDGAEARGRDDAPQPESTVRSHVAPPRAILRADRLLALPSISDEDASRQLCCGQAGGEVRCACVRVAPARDAELPLTRTVQASRSPSGSPSSGQALQLLQPLRDDAAARRRVTGCSAARRCTDGATAKSTAIIHAPRRRRICSPLGDSPQAWGTHAQATRGTVLLSPYVVRRRRARDDATTTKWHSLDQQRCSRAALPTAAPMGRRPRVRRRRHRTAFRRRMSAPDARCSAPPLRPPIIHGRRQRRRLRHAAARRHAHGACSPRALAR